LKKRVLSFERFAFRSKITTSILSIALLMFNLSSPQQLLDFMEAMQMPISKSFKSLELAHSRGGNSSANSRTSRKPGLDCSGRITFGESKGSRNLHPIPTPCTSTVLAFVVKVNDDGSPSAITKPVVTGPENSAKAGTNYGGPAILAHLGLRLNNVRPSKRVIYPLVIPAGEWGL